MPRGDAWTEEEKRILRERYAQTPNAQLVRELGRSSDAVAYMASHLGLRRARKSRIGGAVRDRLTHNNGNRKLPDHLREAFWVFLAEEVVEPSPIIGWQRTLK